MWYQSQLYQTKVAYFYFSKFSMFSLVNHVKQFVSNTTTILNINMTNIPKVTNSNFLM